MATKIKTIEVSYTTCDWCDREIDGDAETQVIIGDFPTIVLHKEPCVRQAIVKGIEKRPH